MPGELVHFEGEFGPGEKDAIVKAITEAERYLPDPGVELGARWVVASNDVPGHSRVIAAHRMGETRAIVAKTPQQLIESIQTYARSRSKP